MKQKHLKKQPKRKKLKMRVNNMPLDMDALAELNYSDSDPAFANDDEENENTIERDACEHIKSLMCDAFSKMDNDDLEYLDQKLDYQIYDFFKEWEKRR